MASIRRHPVSGNWQVRYRDPTGTPRTKTFKRQVDARAFADDVETDKRRGTYIDPNAGTVTFAEYAHRWLATRAHLAPATLDRDRSYLSAMILPTFANRSVGMITASEVEVWMANLDRADTTRAKALQIVRSILDLARRDRAIPYNPAADAKPPQAEPDRIGRALSDEEVSRLLVAAEQVDETTAGVVWVMVRGGLRIGEAIGLQRSDVDLDGQLLQVRRSVNRRGDVAGLKHRKREDQGRTIPMPADLSDRLRRHLTAASVASLTGWLFTAPQGGHLDYGNWRRRVWKPTISLAAVDANPHDLRHTAITGLILVDRWSPAEVQRFAGHRDPRVTLAIYTHLSTADLRVPSRLNAI